MVGHFDQHIQRGNTFWALAMIVVTPFVGNSASHDDYSLVCDRVSSLASKATGVPLSVLSAISLAETGQVTNQKFTSWPWTVNMEGKGIWFKTEADANTFVHKELQRGAKNFDVGCFQLNYRWHGEKFSSIEEMFDPNSNALYAANFLKKLYLEKGNWTDAAGAYHSRTPKYANKYKARFSQIHLKYHGNINRYSSPVQPPKVDLTEISIESPTSTKFNQFPLLQSSSSRKMSLGSLFPAELDLNFVPFFQGG